MKSRINQKQSKNKDTKILILEKHNTCYLIFSFDCVKLFGPGSNKAMTAQRSES